MDTMEKLTLGAMKLGLHLSPEQVGQFQTYYENLTDWNQRINLTAIIEYEEVQIKHFLDSLTIIPALRLRVQKILRIIDVGTGAGLPGVPLKIMFPEIELTLLEAKAKKATFLNHLKNALGLNDIEIVPSRAEDMAQQSQYREKFDIVLSRALASLPTLVELTLPFCSVGGCFVAQKKGDIQAEIRQANRAINLLGGTMQEMKRVELAELAEERWLIIIDKISPTPPQYPRRPGIPSKRPLLDKQNRQ